MIRADIISTIGRNYLVSNIENGEFSYVKALRSIGKNIRDFQYNTDGTHHQNIDIRFENDRLVVLVECKNKFSRWDKSEIQRQLQEYVRYEKEYTEKRMVAILAETEGDEVWTWYGGSVIIDDQHRKLKERTIKSFEEYENLCFGKINNKIKIVDSIKQLNELLHSNNIKFALSNVLRSKGKENSILINWTNKNSNKYRVINLNFDYNNSNYQVKDKNSVTEEVLIINY